MTYKYQNSNNICTKPTQDFPIFKPVMENRRQHKSRMSETQKGVSFSMKLEKVIKKLEQRQCLNHIVKSQALATLKHAVFIEKYAKNKPQVGCSADLKYYIVRIINVTEKEKLNRRLKGNEDVVEEGLYKGCKMACKILIDLYEEVLEIN